MREVAVKISAEEAARVLALSTEFGVPTLTAALVAAGQAAGDDEVNPYRLSLIGLDLSTAEHALIDAAGGNLCKHGVPLAKCPKPDRQQSPCPPTYPILQGFVPLWKVSG